MSSKRRRKQQRKLKQQQQEARPEQRLLVCMTQTGKFFLALDSTGGPMMVLDWHEAHVWSSAAEACAYMDRMTGLKLVTLVVR